VPYWVVAQREDSDISALKGLIDIAEEDEEPDTADEFIKDCQDYGIDDLEGDEDQDYDNNGEGDDEEKAGDSFDGENYDDFIDEKF